jgi:SLOG family YspA-like protein
MKTIIAGSRDIFNFHLVVDAVAACGFEITEIVCGWADGVDKLGFNYAMTHEIPCLVIPARWKQLGKSAGMIRNQEMAQVADALICIHHGTPGSLGMLEIARRKGLKIYEVNLSLKEPRATGV